MIDRSHDLPVTRQCQILSLARSTAYYRPQQANEADLALMRKIDELHLEYPFAGSRMLRDMLRQDGHAIGRKHVATLMKRMNIEAVYKKPNTSRRHPAHAVYPYLLSHMDISRPNHVFAADITYIPMKRGFVYLFAVMDWASRRVLAWRLSNTLTTDFLYRGGAASAPPLRQAGHLQYRPGQPIHEPGIYPAAQGERHCCEHGWSWLLAR